MGRGRAGAGPAGAATRPASGDRTVRDRRRRVSTILVTGASGFVGSRLVPRLEAGHKVVALSRKPLAGAACTIRGDFSSFENLHQLDAHQIDAVVHLAGEVGGTSEEAGLATNVLGTRRLLRYLSDRGCRKFVLASSIAAVGCLHAEFVPQALPIADRHPCLARDAYGLSKAMVEQLAAYFARIVPDGEYTCLRFGWVMYSSRKEMPWSSAQALPALPFLYLGQVTSQDLLDGICAVLEAPVRPGAGVYNLVGPNLRVSGPVADVLRGCLGERGRHLDLAAHEVAGVAAPPIFAMDALHSDYGFVPSHSVCELDPETVHEVTA
ncbi:MAG: NAD(P)-dependent oxidoreductase [Betaproteobacteria bacterium]|nr:NAD(P)-dependent oxidoreductase [Betaproteobacteria bacterium]